MCVLHWIKTAGYAQNGCYILLASSPFPFQTGMATGYPFCAYLAVFIQCKTHIVQRVEGGHLFSDGFDNPTLGGEDPCLHATLANPLWRDGGGEESCGLESSSP